MMWLSILFSLCFVLHNAKAEEHFVRMETMNEREDFVKSSKTPPSNIHEVVIAVKQNNLDLLETMVLERSTPGSALYQQWLTFEEVGKLVCNHEANSAIKTWISQYSDISITWESKRGEYIKAAASVERWEALLNTSFYEWDDVSEPQVELTYTRAEEYSIPSTMREYITSIFYTSQAIPKMTHKAHNKRDPKAFISKFRVEGNPGPVTISFLQNYYSVPTYIRGNASLSQSVFETSGQSFSPSDLQQFQSTYGVR